MLATARQLGSPILTAFALGTLANAIANADPVRGRALLVEGVAYQRSLGTRYLDDGTLLVTAWTAAMVREHEIALRAAAQMLDRRLTGEVGLFAPMLETIAASIVATAPEEAAMVHGMVDTIAPW